jgi:hypothetical protein
MTFLVQRMRQADREWAVKRGATGVDVFYNMDHMGSAEFEYGALGDSLRTWRSKMSDGTPVEKVVERIHADPEFWFAGKEEHLKDAEAFVLDQLQGWAMRKIFLREPSRFDDPKIQGWWCVDRGAVWAVFRAEQQAKDWLTGIKDN